MARARHALVAFLLAAGALVATAPAASAATSVTVTPHTDLADGQQVTVEGNGFAPNASIAICEGVKRTPPSVNDCGSGIAFVNAVNGSFSTTYVVSRTIFNFDCAFQPPSTCFIGAADTNDIAGTIAYAPLDFLQTRPDAFIQAVGDPSNTKGDNLYTVNAAGQTRTHAVGSNGMWSWATRFQNDGADEDDIKVTGPGSTGQFSVRYFVGYFDVTAQVTGSGFVFQHVTTGETRKMAVQVTATGATSGGTDIRVLTASSVASPSTKDAIGLRTTVP
jgi:hypothetical protein